MSALTLGLIAAVCWGIHDITIRYLSRRVPLMAALFMVLLVGAVFQGAAILALKPITLFETQALIFAIGSGFAFLLASAALYLAFERGPVRLVAPIIGSYPLLTMAFAAIEGTQFMVMQWFAVLVIISGISMLALSSDEKGPETSARNTTIGLSFLSAIGFASTFKLGHMAATISDELSTTLIARMTALFVLGLLIYARRWSIWPGKHALMPLCIMGILDGIALIAIMAAADKPMADFAAVSASTFGLFTVLLAWVFLREPISKLQWFCCVLIFAALGYLAL